jgi:hypothetical protein
MKKKSNRKKGIKFENKAQKTLMSGGLWHSPLDINYGDYCVECKFSDKKGYRISTELLEKIWGQALDMGKEPMLILGIKRNDNQIFTLHCQIQLERKDN